MPWTGKEFSSRHNHNLKGKSADKAASIANAMLARGADEGVAIATANKRAGHGAKRRTGKTTSRVGAK